MLITQRLTAVWQRQVDGAFEPERRIWLHGDVEIKRLKVHRFNMTRCKIEDIWVDIEDTMNGQT